MAKGGTMARFKVRLSIGFDKEFRAEQSNPRMAYQEMTIGFVERLATNLRRKLPVDLDGWLRDHLTFQVLEARVVSNESAEGSEHEAV
jgi:hypothetical protein